MPRIRRNELPNFQRGMQGYRQMLNALPKVIGTIAVNFFDDRFDEEGWINTGMEKWKPRKEDKDSGKKRSTRRGLLIESGDMRRGIHFTPGRMQVVISNNVKYAAAHNDGFDGMVSVPAHERKGKPVKAYSYRQHIPKRQFMGESQLLTKRIEETITRSLDQIFKSL